MILKLGPDQYIHWDEKRNCPKTSILSQAELSLYLLGHFTECHHVNELEREEKEVLALIIKLKMNDLMDRLTKNNSTCKQGRCLDEIVKENKAGKDQNPLTITEIIQYYTYDPDKKSFPF